MEQIADTLIDRIAPSGRADLLSECAAVLPLLVFNRLFGCPPDIGDKLVDGMSGIFDADADADSEKANAVLTEGVAELVALKRRQPGPDLSSWLMAHPARLTDEEMMQQLVLLMGAGNRAAAESDLQRAAAAAVRRPLRGRPRGPARLPGEGPRPVDRRDRPGEAPRPAARHRTGRPRNGSALAAGPLPPGAHRSARALPPVAF